MSKKQMFEYYTITIIRTLIKPSSLYCTCQWLPINVLFNWQPKHPIWRYWGKNTQGEKFQRIIKLDPEVEKKYLAKIHLTNPDVPPVMRINRYDFYDRASKAFAVVMTGETAKYGNILLVKGVTPV